MKRTLLPLLSLLLFASRSQAAVVVTYSESPTAVNSTLANTEVFDFNALKTGLNSNVNWSGVGSFDQLFIKSADAYGGAVDATNPNGTKYSVQGAGTSVLTSTLTLDQASSYFGMWWSAGDAKNVLSFYLGDDLVTQFTTASLMDPLPSEYDGNPKNRSINPYEPYGFINFIALDGTQWDHIVFSNNGSSGFESDNYTSRVDAWDPLIDGALPGVPVAVVDGTTTKTVTSAEVGALLAAAPGAPLPPAPMLAAFALAVLFRSRRSAKPMPVVAG